MQLIPKIYDWCAWSCYALALLCIMATVKVPQAFGELWEAAAISLVCGGAFAIAKAVIHGE